MSRNYTGSWLADEEPPDICAVIDYQTDDSLPFVGQSLSGR